nr:uncharacterized protein LOC129256673 [Lytechinus pictus]
MDASLNDVMNDGRMNEVVNDEGGMTPCSERQPSLSSESLSESDDDSIITSIPSGDWCFPQSCDDYSPVTRVNIVNLEIEMEELKEALRQVEFERDAALDKSQKIAIDLDIERRYRKLDQGRYLDDINSLVTDKSRLSTVEEELRDVIVLIMRLRDMNLSKRSLGKIIFDISENSLHSEKEAGHNLAGNFIHILLKELLQCDSMLTNGNLNSTRTNGINQSTKNHSSTSIQKEFHQSNDDRNIQEDSNTPKRPSGFPADLIKSGFEMKC